MTRGSQQSSGEARSVPDLEREQIVRFLFDRQQAAILRAKEYREHGIDDGSDSHCLLEALTYGSAAIAIQRCEHKQ